MRFLSSLLWQLYCWSARHSGHPTTSTEYTVTLKEDQAIKAEGTELGLWRFGTGGAAGV